MMGPKDNKSYVYILVVVLVILGIGFAISVTNEPCCPATSATPLETNINISNASMGSIATVQIYHFHGTHQCYSCVKLGELAEKTVNTYFADELESGKLVFDHINYDLPENKELKERFEVTGSSLWIGTTIDGVFSKEQNTNVWYKIEDESGYLSYLKGILDKRLSGDLN